MIDIDGFLNYMYEEELSENTRNSYIFAVKSFAKKFDEVSKQNIVAWKQELMESKSPQTVNLRLTAIEKYCKYKNQKIDVKRIKVHKMHSIENVITAEEYQRLLDGLINDGYMNHAIIIVLMAKTGARISEVLRFRKKDLSKDYIDIKTKGKIRRIYFPESLKVQIKDWIADKKDDDYLCCNHYGVQITSRGVAGFLISSAEKYNIPKSHLHPHAFRHMFAIEFLKRNSNISLLADILGHSGINTTMIYLRMSQQQQKSEIDKAVNW